MLDWENFVGLTEREKEYERKEGREEGRMEEREDNIKRIMENGDDPGGSYAPLRFALIYHTVLVGLGLYYGPSPVCLL